MTFLSRASFYIALVALGTCIVAGGASAAEDIAAGRQERIERAIAGGIKFLSGQTAPDGQIAGEYPQGDRRHIFGGKTALAVYALISAGADEQRNAATRRAVDWLVKAKLDGVYPVAMRACAMAAMKSVLAREHLAADVQWLVEAADKNGAYTYTHQGGRKSKTYDNSSSQMAVMGVQAGVSRGLKVPKSYWRKVRQHWLDQQQVDGGWGYCIRPRAVRTRSYGSMTAAGLATLYACFDYLQADQFVRCTASPEYKPITKALDWLAGNFSAEENPGKGVEWYYYWLFCVQRVGLAGGYKYFGGDDWYARGSAELLRRCHDDGSWGVGKPSERIVPTAFAILFLARGRHPVLFNKLQYTGRWNCRPRDLANLTRWLSYTFERPMSWQVVGLNSSLEDWHDAPILYISGAGPCELSEIQIRKLREFVMQGGMILSEAACNSGTFTLDMRKLYKKLFPRRPLKRLDDTHPIYSMQFLPKHITGLSGLSNGIRMLAVHSPRELSLGLQLGPTQSEHLEAFWMMANIHLFATDRGTLRPRGSSLWPKPVAFKPVATIRVARIRHAGNCDPEPLAWRRLAIITGNRRRIRLVVSPLMPPAKLNAKDWPLAAITGTEAFTLSSADAAALVKYLADGGTLIIDAADGSKAFAASVRRQIVPLVPGGTAELIAPEHPIYKPLPEGRIMYRRDFARILGSGAKVGRLRGVTDVSAAGGERLAIVFSGDDMTGGLVGYPCHKLRGYAPATAVDLMISILTHVAGVKAKP